MAQGQRGYKVDQRALDLQIQSLGLKRAYVGRAIGRDGQYITGLICGRVGLAAEYVEALMAVTGLLEAELLIGTRKEQNDEIRKWKEDRQKRAGQAQQDRNPKVKVQPSEPGRWHKCKSCKGRGWYRA